MSKVTLTWPTFGRTFTRPADEKHVFVLPIRPRVVASVAQRAFTPGGFILLPGVPVEIPDSEESYSFMTGLEVLIAALAHVRDNGARHLLVTGHCGNGESITIAKARAANVLALLQGDRSAWARSCKGHTPADLQAVLRWMWYEHGYPCEPEPIGTDPGSETTEALKAFRHTYAGDKRFSQDDLPKDPDATEKDWAAAFDLVNNALSQYFSPNKSDLDSARQKLQPLPSPALGCGDAITAGEPAAEIHLFKTADLPDLAEQTPAAQWLYWRPTMFPSEPLEPQPRWRFHFSS